MDAIIKGIDITLLVLLHSSVILRYYFLAWICYLKEDWEGQVAGTYAFYLKLKLSQKYLLASIY